MPPMVGAAAIGGVSSILGGLLAGRPKTSTSTTTPTWTPAMQTLQGQLANYSSGLMTDPSAGVAPMRTTAEDDLNRRYAAMPGQISQQMAARGYGSSGSFGNTMYQSGYQRSGQMSDLDSQFAQMILNQKNKGADLSSQLLNMTRGSTSTGTTPDTSMPDAFMSAGNGLSNISTLFALSKLMKGGGLGGGGGSGLGGGGDTSADVNNTDFGG